MVSRLKIWIPRIALLTLILTAGLVILRKHISHSPAGDTVYSSDVLSYVSAAENMRSGQNIYVKPDGQGTSYVYPPFLAWMLIPLSYLHPLLTDVLWFGVNILFIGVVVRQATDLFSHNTVGSLPRGTQWILASVSIFLSMRYLVRNAQDANINMALLALVIGGFLLMKRRRSPAWVALIGVAAAIKILPLVFVLYFLARREWKATACLMGGFLVATLIPIVSMGWVEWAHSMQSFSRYSQAQLMPIGLEIENFSIWGLVGRLFSHNKAFDGENGAAVFINVADLPTWLLHGFVYAANVTFLALFYVTSRWGATGRLRTKNGDILIGLLTMNLVSILTEDHHTVAFMVVYLYLLIGWFEGWSRGLVTALVAIGTGLCSLIISHDVIVPLFGRLCYNYLLALSVPVLPVGIALYIMVFSTVRPEKITHQGAQ